VKSMSRTTFGTRPSLKGKICATQCAFQPTKIRFVLRTGKSAKLTIRQEGQEGKALEFTKEEALTGTHSILNLDQEHSKLFIGGYPTSFSIQDSVKYSSFEGQIEDLVIGDTPVGLWNFADAVNNENAAIER
jgi:laminin, alpha 3/5